MESHSKDEPVFETSLWKTCWTFFFSKVWAEGSSELRLKISHIPAAASVADAFHCSPKLWLYQFFTRITIFAQAEVLSSTLFFFFFPQIFPCYFRSLFISSCAEGEKERLVIIYHLSAIHKFLVYFLLDISCPGWRDLHNLDRRW